jgi:CBS domain-containing protein
MARVQDIMTSNPVTCNESDIVFKAVEVMKRQDVGVVPIVERNGTCKGIVTDRDIVLEIIYNQKDPNTTLLRDIMTTDLLTCNMDEDVDVAIQNMRSRKVKRILIVDRQGHCIGIISEADLAQKIGEPGKVGSMAKGVYGSDR